MTGPLSVAEAGRRLRKGEMTSEALLDSVLSAAASSEAQIHAFLTIDRERAVESAQEADADLERGIDHGPLHGIPVAVKDNMCTRGVETTAASQILAGYRPPYDATVVTRLREAGAVVVGKTNLDEFAMGSSTENSAYGPTYNPWDTTRVAGGLVGRIGCCRRHRVRPRRPRLGHRRLDPPAGLAVRSGRDEADLRHRQPLRADRIRLIPRPDRAAHPDRGGLGADSGAIWGHDPLDSTSLRGPYPDPGAGLGRGVAGLRVGVVDELSGEGYEPAVESATAEMVSRLESSGMEVVRVSLPSFEIALSAYYLIAPAECSANLARFDGVRYGLRSAGATTEQMMGATRAEGFGPEVTRRILLGTYALSAGYYDAFYGQAQRVRAAIQEDFARAYEQVDVLVSPTSPTVAFEAGCPCRRPPRHVPVRHLHDPLQPGGSSGDLGPGGAGPGWPADRLPGDGARHWGKRSCFKWPPRWSASPDSMCSPELAQVAS